MSSNIQKKATKVSDLPYPFAVITDLWGTQNSDRQPKRPPLLISSSH